MPGMPRRSLLAAALLAFAIATPAFAQSPTCNALCGAACVKPWAIPDRWDDVTGIPGYMGEGAGRARNPEWRRDGRWNREAFTDQNANGLFDVGEPYVDGNANGVHAEAYHPILTGYIAAPVAGNLLSPDGDIGLDLVLHSAANAAVPEVGGYLPVAFPPVNAGTPAMGGAAYKKSIDSCDESVVLPGDRLEVLSGGFVGPTNQGMQGLIARDPDATWDPTGATVANSAFPLSPRVILLPLVDPRVPAAAGNALPVVKVAAFFLERMVGPAEARGKLLRSAVPAAAGPSCGAGPGASFIVDCPVPALAASWGRLKATYR
jgi:hypothetical protein